jgi:hypothetical protein
MAKKNRSIVKDKDTQELEAQLNAVTNEAIASGEAIDYEKLEKLQGPVPVKAGGIETYYDYLPGDYYDKFEDYINPNTLKGRALSLDQ